MHVQLIRVLRAALVGSIVGSASACAREFFVFDNGVGRDVWSPEQQAVALKETGYDGISYNYTTNEDLARWLVAFDTQGLKIYGLYVGVTIGDPVPVPPGLGGAIKMLRGRGTALWLTVRSVKNTHGDQDEAAVALVRRVATMAAESHLRVALYGHQNLYIETAEDCVRIVKKTGRDNVRGTINLCHELLKGNAARLGEIVTTCAPYIILASINGAEPRGAILRLDQGSFDVAGFVRQLDQAGYRGPIGLQCWSVRGEIRENLERSMAAWRKMSRQLP